LVAAVGVAVLGAFLVVERRREFAILRTLGADSRQVTIPTAVEGGLAIAGSLLFGIPLGLLLGTLAVRVLGLFFTLPPPLLAVPVWTLVGLGALVVTASAAAMTVALRAVTRVRSAVVLREP
ncbi:MAG: FtsX-like permease family protein, partial [Nocardioidaceae bacterium]